MKYRFDAKNVFAIDLLGNNYIQLLEENQNKRHSSTYRECCLCMHKYD